MDFKAIVDQARDTRFSGTNNIQYPEYTGKTFKEFWNLHLIINSVIPRPVLFLIHIFLVD